MENRQNDNLRQMKKDVVESLNTPASKERKVERYGERSGWILKETSLKGNHLADL